MIKRPFLRNLPLTNIGKTVLFMDEFLRILEVKNGIAPSGGLPVIRNNSPKSSK